MVVTSINEYRSRETVSVLRHLLERAEKGEIMGAALCVKTIAGPEEIAFAGVYRLNPAKAVNAANRMSWRMTQLQDEIDARKG
jgi:hypothetical protein